MLLTAFIMGLAGSIHCAGMCSPLVMAVTQMSRSAFYKRVIYNLGRITTYGILGAIVSTIGYILPLQKYQNVLSVTLGLVLVLLAVRGVTTFRVPLIMNGVTKFSGVVRKLFSGMINQKSYQAMWLLGALNGLLPCGLTFLALTFCLAMPSPEMGLLYMFSFGAGTLPVMLGLVSIIPYLTGKLHWKVKTVTTGLMALSGILLIARVFLVHLPETRQYVTGGIDIICR